MRRCSWSFAGALLVGAGAAGAQSVPQAAAGRPAAEANPGLEEAKALTRQAEIQYKLGQFDAALTAYSAAYQKYPTPALLLNIGQCQKMLKNYEQAIFFYRGYLRDKPDAANRAAVEALIAEAKHNLDAQQAEAAAQQEQKRQADELARAQASVVAPPSPPVLPPSTASSGSALRTVGIVTAGVGVAIIATGIVFGLESSSASSSLEQKAAQHQPWTSADQSLYGNGSTFATAATALTIAGGVAIATGGVLAILGWPKKGTEAAPAPSIAPTQGGAALLLRGVF